MRIYLLRLYCYSEAPAGVAIIAPMTDQDVQKLKDAIHCQAGRAEDRQRPELLKPDEVSKILVGDQVAMQIQPLRCSRDAMLMATSPVVNVAVVFSVLSFSSFPIRGASSV